MQEEQAYFELYSIIEGLAFGNLSNREKAEDLQLIKSQLKQIRSSINYLQDKAGVFA